MVESHPRPPERPPVAIRKITPADFDPVVETLGRAFDADPVANFLVKQDARRAERLRRGLRYFLQELTFPYGDTYVTEGFEGAALWNPPNQRPHGVRADLGFAWNLIRRQGLWHFAQVIGGLNEVERRHPKEPHYYYLFVLGVDPEHQGKGIGSGLMAPMLERAEGEGMPAYLESSNERNLPLYERHGFRVVEEMTLGRRGPRLWRMWRDSQ